MVVCLRFPVDTTKTTRIYYIVIAYDEFCTVFFKDLWRYFFEFGYAQMFPGANSLGVVNVSLSPSSALLCTLVNFLWFAHEILASNTIVMFELERVVALYFPFKARHLFTQKKALLIVALIAVGRLSCRAFAGRTRRWGQTTCSHWALRAASRPTCRFGVRWAPSPSF